MEFNSVAEVLSDLRKGKSIVVVDDQNRENEGDIVFAASKSTPAKINFMAKHARGLICVALTADRAEQLQLHPMSDQNHSRHETAFTVSVEAREGTTTGISAADRSLTTRALADTTLGREAFISPGHVFPIKARRGGVLVRAGHTEAAVDLMQLANLGCAGVICEIMNEDGSMARLPDCMRFAKKHGLKILSVEALIEYRRTREKLVRSAGSFPLPTNHGDFRVYAYEDLIHGRKHFALVKGEIKSTQAVMVRVHSECLFGDAFGSRRCDCGQSLEQGLRTIGTAGGVFLYMRQANSEADFDHKLNRMDARTYGIGAQILYDLGLRRLNLLTNHPKRIQGLEGYGLRIVRQTPFTTSSRTPRPVTRPRAKRAKETI